MYRHIRSAQLPLLGLSLSLAQAPGPTHCAAPAAGQRLTHLREEVDGVVRRLVHGARDERPQPAHDAEERALAAAVLCTRSHRSTRRGRAKKLGLTAKATEARPRRGRKGRLRCVPTALHSSTSTASGYRGCACLYNINAGNRVPRPQCTTHRTRGVVPH